MNNIISDNMIKDTENKNKIRRIFRYYGKILCVGCSKQWFARYYKHADSSDIVCVPHLRRCFDIPYGNFELIYVYDINLVEDPSMLCEVVSYKSDLLLENVFITPKDTSIIHNKHSVIDDSGVAAMAGVFHNGNLPYIFSHMNNECQILHSMSKFYDRGEYFAEFVLSQFPNFNAFDDTMPFELCAIICEVDSRIVAERKVTALDLKFTDRFSIKFHVENLSQVIFKVYSSGASPFAVNADIVVGNHYVLEYGKQSFAVNTEVKYETGESVDRFIYAPDHYSVNIGCDLVDMSIDDDSFTDKISFIADKLDDNDAVYFKYIITRLMKGCKTFGMYESDMTETEIADFKNIKNTFYDSIRKQDDTYLFGNYKFPGEIISPGICFNFGMDCINIENFSGKDAIDAGAYLGDSSLVFAQYGFKTVYAFEPETSSYDMLLKTISLNNMDNKIIPIKKGIGAAIETRYIKWNYSASAIIDETEAVAGAEKIDIISIDDFAETNNLEVGLIKSDTEGFERYLIAGAEKTIRKDRPVLIISIYHSAEDLLNLIPQILAIEPSYKLKLAKLEPASRIIDTIAVFY